MVEKNLLQNAYSLMCMVSAMAKTYDDNRSICKYVHSTSRGHEAIQIATALQLTPIDFISPYYRDESILLGLGFTPYQLMLQLLAKADDIFTAGRSYYSHPNFKGQGKPTIIHQSSATGMQAIPTTGVAQGIKFLNQHTIANNVNSVQKNAVVICSLGDASVTEGEVSEALQFAALHQLPIIYLVQDNEWGISVTKEEARATNASEFVKGFGNISRISIDGSDFLQCYEVMKNVVTEVRTERKPFLVHAKVPLLGHHTSGVRKEFYRTTDNLEKHQANDPLVKLHAKMLQIGFTQQELEALNTFATQQVQQDFLAATQAPEPEAAHTTQHVFAPTIITAEAGQRAPQHNQKVLMVDAALFAIREIMEQHPEAILYGQDVGRRLGGVFREAATLAEQFGDHRVFNTAIQEAYIIGSTIGMCAVGLKPIVEIQFADYIYPGLNQLVTEISKSCYLSAGKFAIQTLIRIPIGAYGGGGPYHSGSIESMLLTIKGIKVVYPSNAADMKGLMKAAFLDPNPVIMLEHKGLYWSKVPSTEAAKTIEPAQDYIIPLGKAAINTQAQQQAITNGESCVVVTYGMGVYWAQAAAKNFNQQIEIIDLRTLYPLDETLVFERVQLHGRCLVLTEETQNNSFAEAFAARISKACFKYLDAPIEVLGALNLPAVPINTILENEMLPNAQKVTTVLAQLLQQ
jgi:2-oxoisovalerate dehydrogenase E1 component